MAALVTPRTLKGFRDFFPQEVIKRNYLKQKIVEVFTLYGFEPIETPLLEYLDTFKGNIGEDEKLFFHFLDHGNRAVALRYDQTVPTCRFIAEHRDEIQFPFKRYQIQPVYRAEKPQKGRYREFVQCDADIFGVKGPEADAELIALTIDIYTHLGFKDFVVKINDRALFRKIAYPVIVAIDKLAKIGRSGVIEEIVAKGYSHSEAKNMLDEVLRMQPNDTLNTIFSYLKNAGFSQDHYQFDPSLARSFSYSTGPIWEVTIAGFDQGSVLGGERFDKLVGRFQKEDIPGTGFGLGFPRTFEAMEQFGLFPASLHSVPRVMVSIFSPLYVSSSVRVASQLRESSIATEVYPDTTHDLSRQLKYAVKKGIEYVIIIGEEEEKSHAVTVKELATRTQHSVQHNKLVEFFLK
ncbi:MAG: histidine--tRNA ligase [Candidatus Roizmanbacteria bacterium]|nr:histidine--tRNA ligase [Candidatus Roizmanbacteria bacterium]